MFGIKYLSAESCTTPRNFFELALLTSLGLAKEGLFSCIAVTLTSSSARAGGMTRGERAIPAATAIPAAIPTALLLKYHGEVRRDALSTQLPFACSLLRLFAWFSMFTIFLFAFFT